MGNTNIDPQKIWTKKDELLRSVSEALESLGLEMDLDSIHLQAKRTRKCPPGYVLVFEPVEHPDGSVTYQWICKKS